MHRKLLWRSSPLRHISAVVSDVGTPSTSLITISSLPANTSAASSATTPAPDAVFEGDEYSIHRRRKEWRLRGLPPYLVSHSAALSAIFPRGEVAAKDVVRLLSINGQAVEEIPAKAIRESMLPDQRYTIVVSLERPQPQQQQQQQQQDDDNDNAERKTTVVAKKVGRGRKKMVQTVEEHTPDAHVESAAPTPKRRGRPAGSCNKNKMLAAPPVEPVEVDEKHTTLKMKKVGRVRRRRTATVVMDEDAATPSSSSTSATLPLDDAVAAVLQSFQTSQTAAETTTTTTTTTLGSTELRRKRGRKPAATKEVAKSEDVDGIHLQHEQPSSSSIPLPTKVKVAGKRAGRRTLPRDGESLAF